MIVVPLQVVLDGVSAPESQDGTGVANITGREVADALRAGRTVTTSRPSVETFAGCYRRLAEDGAEEVVSVHLSRAISGTYDAAVTAARDAPVPVTVLDSATLAMALGFAALAGAQSAGAGAGPAQVAELVRCRAAGSAAYFSVDSLEYLRRGGRIGAARALLGSALAVKPLLTVAGGLVAPYERVRTRAKALARLHELAFEAAVAGATSIDALAGDGGAVDLAVHHLDDRVTAEGIAAELREALRGARVQVGDLVVSEMSAVLGVHVGPGTLGVIVSPHSAAP